MLNELITGKRGRGTRRYLAMEIGDQAVKGLRKRGPEVSQNEISWERCKRGPEVLQDGNIGLFLSCDGN